MRIIPTRIHGFLDYIIGLALIGAPWIFGFAPDMVENWGPETWMPIGVGFIVILQSLFTNFEWGYSKHISMPTHLMTDVILGALLATSPWALNYAGYVYGPHLIVGLAMIGLAAITQKSPQRSTPGFSDLAQARY